MTSLETLNFDVQDLNSAELALTDGGIAPLAGYAIYAACAGAGMLIGWALN